MRQKFVTVIGLLAATLALATTPTKVSSKGKLYNADGASLFPGVGLHSSGAYIPILTDTDGNLLTTTSDSSFASTVTTSLVSTTGTVYIDDGTNPKIQAAPLAGIGPGNLYVPLAVDGSGKVITSGGAASVAWGAITGTLSNQTDLQSAIDAKVSDTAYDATTWNAVSTVAPSKNAVRDKLVDMDSSISTLQASSHAAVTIGTANGLSLSTQVLSLQAATDSLPGALTAADHTAFSAKVTGNGAITGATKTKITYDSKGLVTAGADIAASDLPTGIDAAKIANGTVSNAEFQSLSTVSSNIQDQLNAITTGYVPYEGATENVVLGPDHSIYTKELRVYDQPNDDYSVVTAADGVFNFFYPDGATYGGVRASQLSADQLSSQGFGLRFDLAAGDLYQSTGNYAYNLDSGYIYDEPGNISINTHDRQLVNVPSDEVVAWGDISGARALGFFGVSPVIQQTGNIANAMINLGLMVGPVTFDSSLIANLTSKYVLYGSGSSGSTNSIAQNINFQYDSSTARLGVGNGSNAQAHIHTRATAAGNKAFITQAFNGAQTGTLFEAQDSSNNPLVTIAGTGEVGVNTTPVTGNKLKVAESISATLAANKDGTAAFYQTFTPAADAAFNTTASFTQTNKTGSTASSLGQVRAVTADAVNSGSGTVGTLIGEFSSTRNTAASTVTNGAAFYAGSPTASASNLMTNAMGLYVAAQATTGVTNAYSLYSPGTSDKLYVAGSAGFGTTSPQRQFHINGTSASGQFRLSYDSSHYIDERIASNGDYTGTITGGTNWGVGFSAGSTASVGFSSGGNLSISAPTASYFYASSPTGAVYLSQGGFSTYEGGVYSANGDEQIATFDPDEGTYHYFGGNLFGSQSAPQVSGSFGITGTSLPQLTISYDGSNFLNTSISSSGNATFDLNGTKTFTFSDPLIIATSMSTPHLIGTGSTPSIAAGAGAGTTPTVSVAGKDMGGEISVTTGTIPTLSAAVFTMTFASIYGTAPYCTFSPSNSNSALLSGTSMVYVTSSTTTMTFTAGAAALTAATAYKWTYHCNQ